MVDTMVSKVAVVEPVPAASWARKIPTEELAVEFLERARADVWGLVGPGDCWKIGTARPSTLGRAGR